MDDDAGSEAAALAAYAGFLFREGECKAARPPAGSAAGGAAAHAVGAARPRGARLWR